MSGDCQVDFYVLKSAELDARQLACRLALMAWERGHRIAVAAADADQAESLDELMWASPAGRFLPHENALGDTPAGAPVRITLLSGLEQADVVINLALEPVPDPDRFDRLLEIVPHAGPGLKASRDKFRYYRDRGLAPGSHDIRQ
ncbi:MAG: DNA polymerase III subunit chi [Xanthomonadales bacterium]|nr:DNA polymerase III subunit chi [Xanthomonadales bacterium]